MAICKPELTKSSQCWKYQCAVMESSVQSHLTDSPCVAGSQVLKPKNAPHYIPGTTILAVFIGVDALVIFAWRFYLVWANKRKDHEVAKMSISQEEAERRGQELGAQDVTDLRNPFFR